jgi:hypothetical protein
MSDTATSYADFSDTPEENDVVPQRALSWLALPSLILGLASPAALLGPVAWILPLAGVVLGWLALRSIARQPDLLCGRGLAWAGLVPALVFGAWAPSNYYLRQAWLSAQARQHARQWIELVASGQRYAAHQLHLRQLQRRSPSDSLESAYADRQARQDFEDYFRREPMRKLLEIGPQGHVRYVRDVRILSSGSSSHREDIVIQRFALDYRQDGQPACLDLYVTMLRSREAGKSEAHWRMEDIADRPPRG